MADAAPTPALVIALLSPMRSGANGCPSVRARLSWRWPRTGTTFAAGLGTLVSLAPGLLPRTATTQAVLTGLLVAVALAMAGIIRLVMRRGDRTEGPVGPRRLALAVAVIAVLAAVVHAGAWQNTLRAAMDIAPIGPGYWVRGGFGAVLFTGLLVWATRGTRRLLRWVGWSRAAVTAVVAGLLMAFFGMPALVGWGKGTYAAVTASADPDMVRPAAFTRSGSAGSMVSWTSLGREGRRFVTSGPPGAVQVYVGLRSAPDPASRAELAVRELERAGGFDRSHLVVAVPTGSGWVDARALAGFGIRFGGDVAVVALQYSYAPSWATFVFGRRAAADSAQALFTAVEKYAVTLPRPPRLYLYGQSLGALGGSAVFAGPADQNRRVCSVLWAGKPGGGGPEPGARTAVLANISDPVVHWSPELLWRPPDLRATRHDAPTPRWLPVVSFLQTTADLLGALDAPPGHGHRYGIDQGTVLPACDRTG